MSITTRLTELLRIEHPILLAPMDLVADGRLAVAVSRAGGFGIIGGGYGDEAWLTRELDTAANARIGVGFITWSLAKRPRLLDIALERRPAAIMLSFGEVAPYVDTIKRAGALLICQVQTLEQAKDAVSNGADVLVVQGAEAGGHGVARGTFPLVPAVVDIVKDIPVAAAGGIADGRGLAAALMLGADGVLMGTRFYATVESGGSTKAKARIVNASGDQTVRSIIFDIARHNVWPAPYSGRVLQNDFSERWRGREAELLQHQDDEGPRYAQARAAEDFDIAAVIAGEVVDLISDIPPAADVIQRVVAQATQLLANAGNRYCRNETGAAIRSSSYGVSKVLVDSSRFGGEVPPLDRLSKISLREKFAAFGDLWSPKTVAEVDDFAVKLVKTDGEFVWHHHAEADEIFLVVTGGIRMKYRLHSHEDEVSFGSGEMLLVPRGVEHMPIAEPGTEVVLFERADLVNTGNAESERTAVPARL